VAQAAASVGSKDRLTGGGPTLRQDLVDIAQDRQRAGDQDVRDHQRHLLPRLAAALKAAGLSRSRPRRLARRSAARVMLGHSDDIWAGIEAAARRAAAQAQLRPRVTT
jgi:molybdenum cofactor biosynthesis enzyme MoaA